MAELRYHNLVMRQCTCLRLTYFKMEPQFWLNLQSNYDIGVAASGAWARIKKLIPEFVPRKVAAAL